MICTPDLYFQEFKLQDGELRQWKHKFLARVNQYYEIKHDPKEQADVNQSELLEEFEKMAQKWQECGRNMAMDILHIVLKLIKKIFEKKFVY